MFLSQINPTPTTTAGLPPPAPGGTPGTDPPVPIPSDSSGDGWQGALENVINWISTTVSDVFGDLEKSWPTLSNPNITPRPMYLWIALFAIVGFVLVFSAVSRDWNVAWVFLGMMLACTPFTIALFMCLWHPALGILVPLVTMVAYRFFRHQELIVPNLQHVGKFSFDYVEVLCILAGCGMLWFNIQSHFNQAVVIGGAIVMVLLYATALVDSQRRVA